jgi:hypothetical protein
LLSGSPDTLSAIIGKAHRKSKKEMDNLYGNLKNIIRVLSDNLQI